MSHERKPGQIYFLDLFFETGGRLHTAIREDASMNQAAIDDLKIRHPNLELVLVESGGDKLL